MANSTSQSYLLRLWREHPGAPLRCTVVPVHQPDERHHFATLDALYTFLREQTGAPSAPSNDLNGATTIVAQIEKQAK